MNTRSRPRTARSLALAILATSMLPLNGCIPSGGLQAITGLFSGLGGIVSSLGSVFQLGSSLTGLTGGSSSGSTSLFQPQSLDLQGNSPSVVDGSYDAAVGVGESVQSEPDNGGIGTGEGDGEADASAD